MQFICDNCGEIVQSGIANISEHQFNCGARKKIKVTDTISYVQHPPLRLTQCEDAEFTEVPFATIVIGSTGQTAGIIKADIRKDSMTLTVKPIVNVTEDADFELIKREQLLLNNKLPNL